MDWAKTMSTISVESVSGLQAAITRQQIDMTVFKKTLDTAKVQSEAVIELIENVVEITDQHQSHGNRHLDVKI